MPHRVFIQSRRGNILLAFLGTTFVLATVTLLGVLLFSIEASQSMLEMMIEVVLVACGITGAWFALMSARNLRAR